VGPPVYRFWWRVDEVRYLRALSAFYLRLTFRSMEIYEILEPLMRDFRKLRVHHAGTSPSPNFMNRH